MLGMIHRLVSSFILPRRNGGMLCEAEIKREINSGRIRISPYNPKQVKANSYDVRLSPTLYRITDESLDFKKAYDYEVIEIPPDGYWLEPGQLYLGCTYERTTTPYHVAEYNGRSTTGRYFLFSHITAGFGDIGFDGHWTLEIMVPRRLKIYPMMRIGQINFQSVQGKIDNRYNDHGGHYNSIDCKPKVGFPGNI